MIFLSVLQRLFDPGSDRACFEWKEDFVVEGVEELSLHHSYRTMAWLGEVLPETEQEAAMPWAPRCVKDLVEERLFERHRDLFTDLELVFFDTTSIYLEGEAGESLGPLEGGWHSIPALVDDPANGARPNTIHLAPLLPGVYHSGAVRAG